MLDSSNHLNLAFHYLRILHADHHTKPVARLIIELYINSSYKIYKSIFTEVKLSYGPSCPSVGLSIHLHMQKYNFPTYDAIAFFGCVLSTFCKCKYSILCTGFCSRGFGIQMFLFGKIDMNQFELKFW